MRGCVILTNRKRAVIAAVHTLVFLIVAIFGMTTVVHPLRLASPASDWIVPGIYVIVTSVLLVLFAVAGNSTERLYFGFCTTSAGFGLLRQTIGDPSMHVAIYVRVAMLVCALWTILLILRASRLEDQAVETVTSGETLTAAE